MDLQINYKQIQDLDMASMAKKIDPKEAAMKKAADEALVKAKAAKAAKDAESAGIVKKKIFVNYYSNNFFSFQKKYFYPFLVCSAIGAEN